MVSDDGNEKWILRRMGCDAEVLTAGPFPAHIVVESFSQLGYIEKMMRDGENMQEQLKDRSNADGVGVSRAMLDFKNFSREYSRATSASMCILMLDIWLILNRCDSWIMDCVEVLGFKKLRVNAWGW